MVLNGEFSDWLQVISGVPQGSVLGPIAFLIFINDIDDITPNISLIKKFADDTKAANVIKSLNDAIELQKAIDDLHDWSIMWGMEFNIDKCHVMHIGKNNIKYDYEMNGKPLKKVSEEKDIGVITSDNLKPNKQCYESYRKATQVLSQITKAFHYRDRFVFKKLYLQYVRPHLEYAIVAWSPWNQSDIDMLEKVQKKAVGYISGLKGSTYEEKLRELDLESLADRRLRIDMTQVFKIVKNKDAVDKNIWFETYGNHDGIGTRLTQYQDNLKRLRISKTEVRNRFFSQRVINAWNALPTYVKDSRSVPAFKNNYTTFVKDGGSEMPGG